MKKRLLAIFATTLLFAGCKENDTPLVITRSADSTYITSSIPASDPHNVLVEEFTGESCSNCPAAHELLEGIVAKHTTPGGTVNVIGMYLPGIPQAFPPNDAKYDLRDTVALSISTAIYGAVGQLPGGGVDRVPVSGSLQLGDGLWDGAVTSQLGITDSLNLQVSSSYNATTNVATIKVTVTYTQPVSTPQNISVVVVEDSITDMQEYPAFNATYPSGFDTFYAFSNVFRGMVSSPPTGDLIQTPSVQKEKGRVYIRTYAYTPKSVFPAIKPKNCRVIAFVNANTGSDYHVVQSVQCHL